MVVNLDSYYREKITKNASKVDLANFISENKQAGLKRNIAEYILANLFSHRELVPMKRKLKNLWNLDAEVGLGGKKRLPYEPYIEMIMDYALFTHIEYLRQVMGYFYQIDHNHNGLFSRKDFMDLLAIYEAKGVKADFDAFLRKVGNTGKEVITFSKTIEILSSTYVDKEGRVNMIQFLRDE